MASWVHTASCTTSSLTWAFMGLHTLLFLQLWEPSRLLGTMQIVPLSKSQDAFQTTLFLIRLLFQQTGLCCIPCSTLKMRHVWALSWSSWKILPAQAACKLQVAI